MTCLERRFGILFVGKYRIFCISSIGVGIWSQDRPGQASFPLLPTSVPARNRRGLGRSEDQSCS